MDSLEKAHLVSMIRQAAKPLPLVEPALPPRFEALRRAKLEVKPKAVLLDVYGTLFSSAAGDIGLAAPADGGGVSVALEGLAGEYGLGGAQMQGFFRQKVAEIHKGLSHKGSWPEVRVEEIWSGFLAGRGLSAGLKAARELALRYELAVNPVFPMPGAREAIGGLSASGFPLGIISNAQFFTPLLFEAFFDASAEGLGFDPGLLIWSFEHEAAKPSPELFDKAAQGLLSRGVKACECLFAGNDMLSDIFGARLAGFAAVLFAGDSRSLRLREGDARLAQTEPSLVIRALGELPGLLQNCP
ncbi:MAG: HAD family hydrolase [Spirochaetes bacterium]|nr:HAD family hydrolase [Spirochaetota bacterium]